MQLFQSLLVACLASASAVKFGSHDQLFTTNAVCSKNRCVNPIFPGLEDLHTLAHTRWTCASLHKVAEHMSFCRPLINYDPALPSGQGDVEALTKQQDGYASTAFFYHMAGLGLEGWDYQQPDLSDDECVKAIWRMSCFTYFPRSQLGCMEGGDSLYLRPCQSSCQNYIRQCGVECCDESVQCVFSHSKVLAGGEVVHTEGYAPFDGPSSFCTGGAQRTSRCTMLALGLPAIAMLFLDILWSPRPSGEAAASSPSRNLQDQQQSSFIGTTGILAGVAGGIGRLVFNSHFVMLLLIATSLQGCAFDTKSLDVPSHTVGNWRAEPDYLLTHQFIPPGGSQADAKINSCSIEHLSQTLQCSGRGVCKFWAPDGLENNHPAAFCECDRDFADPECRTRRKSQAAAYLLSLFFGVFGADQFYLGFRALGLLKLFTLGGFGVWWIIDVIRIGSAPVQTTSFRVGADLPHWVFSLMTIMTALLLGFTAAYFNTILYRARRRKELLGLELEEEAMFIHPRPADKMKANAFSAPSTMFPSGSFAPSPSPASGASYGSMRSGDGGRPERPQIVM